jgi:FAD/FMN-containing dehydrogenase
MSNSSKLPTYLPAVSTFWSAWLRLAHRIEQPAAGLWTYFTNDTCRPTTNPSDTCTLGYYGPLVIMAKTTAHIQAGINFAREHNLRLIIRNTGHDFLGRSVGWGSLIINTHSFQDIKFTNAWRGACDYSGSAVTVGAGVQAFQVLKAANALSPPKIMVTGECGVGTT